MFFSYVAMSWSNAASGKLLDALADYASVYKQKKRREKRATPPPAPLFCFQKQHLGFLGIHCSTCGKSLWFIGLTQFGAIQNL